MELDQLIKYLKKECNEAERNTIKDWIKASDENKKTYGGIKQVWEDSGKVPDSIDPDFEKAWDNIKSNTGITGLPKKSPNKVFIKQFIKVAAVLLFLVGIGAVLNKVFLSDIEIRTETSAGIVGKEVNLPDGSTIYLNRNSEVSFPEKFKGATREVELSGEAFFSISKDKNHPFMVHTNGTVVKVLGTSFNIKADNSSHVLVSVVTGKVAFSPEGDETQLLHLEKGQCGSYDKVNRQLIKSDLSDENFLSWKTGVLNFNDSSLGETVKVLSGYYSKTIEVAPSLKNRLVTVSFDNQALDEVLKILEITFRIEVEESAEKILLKPQSTK